MSFQKQVVLITGATGGIGRAIATQFREQEASVVLTGTNEEALNLLKEQLGEAFVIKADLSKKESIKKMIHETIEQFGRLDVLVNNAGITQDALSLRMSDEQWQKVIDINLTAGFMLIREVLPIMMKQKYGRIVSISSIVGITGNAGQANYSASKAGLMAMTKSIALEMANRGITLNCIAPGFIQTPMTDKLPENVKETLLNKIPVRKFGRPEDIARAVLFLAQKESDYITGQTLQINGGMAMS